MKDDVKREITLAAKRDEVLSHMWSELHLKISSVEKNISILRRKNTAMLKKIIKDRGFPTSDVVGKKGMHDVFYIVQHSDHDLAFQKRCLKQFERVTATGKADKRDLTYLTDRVLVNSGRKQVYGTQVDTTGRTIKLCPTIDVKNLDRRRKDAGLTPYKEYLRSFYKFGGLPKTRQFKLYK